jgi:hypothetical protein
MLILFGLGIGRCLDPQAGQGGDEIVDGISVGTPGSF